MSFGSHSSKRCISFIFEDCNHIGTVSSLIQEFLKECAYTPKHVLKGLGLILDNCRTFYFGELCLCVETLIVPQIIIL